MNEEKRDAPQDNKSSSGTNKAGDPGATPGSAEGDEETVDESLRQHEKAGEKKPSAEKRRGSAERFKIELYQTCITLRTSASLWCKSRT